MTPSAPRPYRVFISYSRDDRKVLEGERAALRRLGVQPWSDADLTYGSDFPAQIQTISHSHLFMPILTQQSHARGWVHQEIGFEVPCVPICVGKVPGGMIALAHALIVNEALSDLDGKLAAVPFDDLVDEAGKGWVP